MTKTTSYQSLMPANEVRTYFPKNFYEVINGVETLAKPFYAAFGPRVIQTSSLFGKAEVTIRENHQDQKLSYEIKGNALTTRLAVSKLAKILGIKITKAA